MKKIAFLIALVLMFSITAQAALVSVSQGKPYSFSTAPSNAYPDNGKMLTDGIHGTKKDESYHKSGTYVGIPEESLDENGCFSITVDLGEVKDNLTGFDLYYTVETDATVYAPEYAEFFVSENGTDYTVAGKVMSGEETSAGILKAGVISGRLTDGKSARYVRFVIKNPNINTEARAEIGWMFVDEVAVLQDDGKTPETGDTIFVPLMLSVLAVSMGAGMYFIKKEKKQQG